jgi:hypothetical protein
VARGEHERGEQQPLHREADQGRVRLTVVGASEQGEVQRAAGEAAARHPPRAGQRDDIGEHGLHGQRRPHLDAHPRLVLARVGERMRDARRDLHDVARAGDARAQADPEAHAPRDHVEALGLDRVHVGDRDGAAGPQGEVEGEQLAAGARRGVGEGEALARDRVLERLTGDDAWPRAHRPGSQAPEPVACRA